VPPNSVKAKTRRDKPIASLVPKREDEGMAEQRKLRREISACAGRFDARQVWAARNLRGTEHGIGRPGLPELLCQTLARKEPERSSRGSGACSGEMALADLADPARRAAWLP
jgi:hypothetical protein